MMYYVPDTFKFLFKVDSVEDKEVIVYSLNFTLFWEAGVISGIFEVDRSSLLFTSANSKYIIHSLLLRIIPVHCKYLVFLQKLSF